ncbi:restriction endonuclease [Oharaeibacter diazotrophicus]|uniref:Restriction system protein n=2 Tax=Oharaeibacter diazotrophicus TaxID=1920512 RepID=A0A4V6PVG7_9HYPH|nr:restriction endonuclease [Oharaeibacter diazotrophicus]TDP85238.1 restriction system protein [Oharaeibacter diazotrophicus]BBE74208.1 restriction endonuclease [Pleomorphomonas sp. SM30]GLS76104.1 restriction endonuclease [Oharaeibacter diazotrophicus]
MSKRGWMVRAERGGRLYDLFKDRSLVAIGLGEIGDLSRLPSRDKIAAAVVQSRPDWKAQAVAMSTGQLHRFRSEMKIGDVVVTYDPGRRIYLVGEIAGDYGFDPAVDPEDPHVRPVRWHREISRDLLSAASRNSLGSISALFALGKDVLDDIERALTSERPLPPPAAAESAVVEEDVFQDIQAKALEFIKDRIAALSWSDMQELVAGLLRALGYKTRVSPTGPDQGKDIVASPDGFGFEPPRIVVEVKHRQGAIGAQAIRSFLGGRHPQDKGLYVSTGGFTRDARYEADRASIPLSLMTGDDLVTAIIEQYEKLDLKTQQLVPLKKVYWPA